MSQDSILFVFHTASKGNMDDLIQKAGLNTKGRRDQSGPDLL